MSDIHTPANWSQIDTHFIRYAIGEQATRPIYLSHCWLSTNYVLLPIQMAIERALGQFRDKMQLFTCNIQLLLDNRSSPELSPAVVASVSERVAASSG